MHWHVVVVVAVASKVVVDAVAVIILYDICAIGKGFAVDVAVVDV